MPEPSAAPVNGAEMLAKVVDTIVAETPVVDMHTHLYAPTFGPLLLWGIDELVTYHYLIAEVLRTDRAVSPADYWGMPTEKRAEHIWQTLFCEATPISEARRGVLTTLKKLGIDVGPGALKSAREYFADVTVEQHLDTVLKVANVSAAVMTNDPFDDVERDAWLRGAEVDPRLKPAMRIDMLLNAWEEAAPKLRAMGYAVGPALTETTYAEIRRFLDDWADRLQPMYLAVSLPKDFAYPADDARARIITRCVLPFCRERGVPFALMIGVKRLVNPDLQLAGDSVGKWNMDCLDTLCCENPDVRFLVTVLAKENQHELCVTARKFPNLLPFGCWWFLNNPSIILEMTRMRVELLGFSFVPQHSDARVLDQLIYKWDHSRTIIAQVLRDKYAELSATGWPVTTEQIQRDVTDLFSGNLADFVG